MRRDATIAWATVVLACGVSLGWAKDKAPSASEPAPPAAQRVLRVCADPNNLPFSNQLEQGFENRMASLLAKELSARLEYTWWVQGRGFFRNTIKQKRCDLVMGVPKELEFVDTTDVVYRSSYVFVTRAESSLELRSLDDPALAAAKIGVHLIGDDYTNTPPVHELARRGIVQNLVGFRINGDYAQPNPPARLLEAVANGGVDMAIVWGPLGGYFAQRQPVPLRVRRIAHEADARGLPLSFDIALGVRHGEAAFKAELNRFIATRRRELDSLLREYGVPLAKEGAHEATAR